jgi:hypothetical protein
MKVLNSTKAVSLSVDRRMESFLSEVFETELGAIVDEISIPRHFQLNKGNNRRVGEWLYERLESFGYETSFQGDFSNIVALNSARKSSPQILIGAHYDSVPDCPGADDNASAIAALMVCARLVAKLAPQIPVCFVAFNCEEDGLVGSTDFVKNYLPNANLKIEQVHILEMIGYASDFENTQKIPPGLPVKIPTTGNFLGILGNQNSNPFVDQLLTLGKTYLPDFSVIGLKLYLGVEKLLPDLGRSDHLPFWKQKIPALMWTDTADFRNPNYHGHSDTPETLNYAFLKKVTQLLLLQILNFKNR